MKKGKFELIEAFRAAEKKRRGKYRAGLQIAEMLFADIFARIKKEFNVFSSFVRMHFLISRPVVRSLSMLRDRQLQCVLHGFALCQTCWLHSWCIAQSKHFPDLYDYSNFFVSDVLYACKSGNGS